MGSQAIQPVAFQPGRDAATTTGRRIDGDLLRPLFTTGWRWYAVVGISGTVVLAAAAAWIYQMSTGFGVSGIRRPVFWGFYIVSFVFWIGISHAGTLISAILRVTGAEWRRRRTALLGCPRGLSQLKIATSSGPLLAERPSQPLANRPEAPATWPGAE